MREVPNYRYFFAFRPPVWICRLIAAGAARHGIVFTPQQLEKLHVTLCVVAELPTQDCFIAKRADDILRKTQLSSCRVKLGRLRGGPKAATLCGVGQQGEIRGFYKELIGLISGCEMEPMDRKSGLKAHVTLAHGSFADLNDKLPIGWYPDELLMIESWVGKGKHVIIGCWPLLPPVQGELGLCA